MQILRPDDYHVHFRQGPALHYYVADCAAIFGRALVMPNTLPPVTDAVGIGEYRAAILEASRPWPRFQPLMTFKVMPDMTPAAIPALKAAGAVAGKLYPQGATTNSADGVAEVEALYPLFQAMEDADLVLCLHGEDPGAFCLDREQAFLPKVQAILDNFPRLKVVLEHVTSAAALDFVLAGPERLGATLTVHHLVRNLDDMLGGHLNPHLFCKPLLKRPADQAALAAAALAADQQAMSRIFFGSDSAPHNKVNKECDCGAAGVYSMPVALPILADLFARRGSLAALEAFTSRNGSCFYGLPLPDSTVTLVEKTWTVPPAYHGVVPLAAGSELGWQVNTEERSC